MPKVSVIVPVYNSEQELRDCLDSLVEQTEKDIEIIVIDDGSTDNSPEIEAEYQKKYPNVKVYRNERNLGQSETRNRGIELAEGDYIAFLDSDDYVNPGMYEELYQAAVDNNMPELIVTGLSFVKGNEYRKKDLTFIGKQSTTIIHPMNTPDQVFFESPSLCNKLFRKDTVKNYKFLDVSAWEDIAFSFTRFLEANTVISKPTANYFYRRDVSDGVSAKNFKENDKITDIFVIADELEEELKRNGKYPFFADQIRGLQIACCLQRVDEVNNWQDEETKTNVKNMMFSTMLEKYGTLDGIDTGLLSSKTGFRIMDEYNDYVNDQKGRKR
jgi:glycosyltransferase involved in cell wall biosynthesis